MLQTIKTLLFYFVKVQGLPDFCFIATIHNSKRLSDGLDRTTLLPCIKRKASSDERLSEDILISTCQHFLPAQYGEPNIDILFCA